MGTLKAGRRAERAQIPPGQWLLLGLLLGALVLSSEFAAVLIEPHGALGPSGASGSSLSSSAAGTLPPPYKIRITETGLPKGTTWYAILNDSRKHTTAQLITFENLTNGSYAFLIENVTGFTAVPTNGTVMVAGSNPTVSVVFLSNNPGGGSLRPWEYFAGGVIVLVVILAIVIVLLHRRSQRTRQPPTPYEVPGSTPPGAAPSTPGSAEPPPPVEEEAQPPAN